MNQKHLHFKIALISFVLLIAQFSVLHHSFDHFFHNHKPSCELFLSAQKTGSGAFFNLLQIPFINYLIFVDNEFVYFYQFSFQTHYHARAPPFFS